MKKIAVILLVIALLAALTGCASVGYVYSNASRYTAGDARISDRVDELEINWVDGSVRIEYYNGDTGAGQGLAPFWGWSSLGYIMKAELEAGFCHSDPKNKTFITLEGFHF